MPILTRIYDVGSIGQYAILLAIANILGATSGARLEMAIVPAKEKERSAIVAAILWMGLPVCVVGLGLIQTFVGLFDGGTLQLEPLAMPITGLLALSILLNNTVYQLNASVEKFTPNSNARVVIATITVTLQLGLPFVFEPGYYLLLIARMIAQLSGLFYVLKGNSFWFKDSSFKNAIKGLRMKLEFLKYYWPSSLVDILAVNAPTILIGSFFGRDFSGYYSIAHKSVTLPSSMASNAISQVFFKRFSDTMQGTAVKYPRVLLKTWVFLFIVGVIPFSTLMVFGEQIVTIVFGMEWQFTGSIVEIISPLALLMFVSSSTSTALLTLNAQKQILLFSLFLLIAKALSLYTGYVLNDLLFGVTIMACLHAIQILGFNSTILVLLKRRKNL